MPNIAYIKSAIISLMCFNALYAQDVFETKTKLMGVDFQFAVVAKNKTEGDFFLNEAITEVQRIEALISSWDTKSQTSKVNRNAGIKAVKVDLELFNLIKRSKRISELSNGYFDISFASIDKIWYFDKPMKNIPDSTQVKASIQHINYKDIILNVSDTTVFLKSPKMKIGFGAIGKGYAAEKVKQLLQQKGATAGLINASGDITCWGDHPKTKHWKVAITNPDPTKNDLAWFNLHNSGVVTSGNYENYIEFNGKRYTHIINPKTGWPISCITSVTIFANNAELADALSTTTFVLGVDKGLKLINQLNGIECIIVDDKNNIYQSKTLKTQFQQ